MPTAAQVAEQAVADLAAANKTIEGLQAEKEVLQRDKHLAVDKHGHAMKRLEQKRRAVSEARADERAKLKEKQKAAKEALVLKLQEKHDAALELHTAQRTEYLDRSYGDKFEAQRKGLNTAQMRARCAEKDAAKAWRKVARLENRIEKMELEDASDDDASDEEEAAALSPGARDVMPRRNESGRFQAEAPLLRVAKWSQLLRGVAPTKVCHNINDIVALLAPGMELPAMTDDNMRFLRTEGTVAGEMMAAWKFAICVRVLSFGWDESTKFGDGVFSCNAQVEYADRTIEDICLRGLSILPEGGKSAAVLAHIEDRILSYSRRRLQQWMDAYEDENGAGSWAAVGGPSPENIGLYRLAEDTVLMTDTCNGARCTKRMLAEAIMRTIEEKVGRSRGRR